MGTRSSAAEVPSEPPPLPPALRRGLDSRRLVVLAGAGISMLPPASLPDWTGSCEALLDGARTKGRDVLGDADPARQAIERIRLEESGAKGESEYLDQIIGACASAIIARGIFDPRLRSSIIPEIRVLEAPPTHTVAVEGYRAGYVRWCHSAMMEPARGVAAAARIRVVSVRRSAAGD